MFCRQPDRVVGREYEILLITRSETVDAVTELLAADFEVRGARAEVPEQAADAAERGFDRTIKLFVGFEACDRQRVELAVLCKRVTDAGTTCDVARELVLTAGVLPLKATVDAP